MSASQHRGRTALASTWQIGAGLLVGLLLMPPLQVEYAAWAERRDLERQRAMPVVTAHGVVLHRTDSYVDIQLSGDKHRQCDVLDVAGFRARSGAAASDVTDAYRVDAPNRRVTRPIGPWDGGVWRLHLARNERGWLQIRHSCDGIVLQSVLARVAAEGNQPSAEP